MTTADVLNQAADLIERDGWWNGVGEMEHGLPQDRHCAELAVSRSGGNFIDAYRVLCRSIGIDEFNLHALARWNDAQPDGATVIAALRAAAQQAR